MRHKTGYGITHAYAACGISGDALASESLWFGRRLYLEGGDDLAHAIGFHRQQDGFADVLGGGRKAGQGDHSGGSVDRMLRAERSRLATSLALMAPVTRASAVASAIAWPASRASRRTTWPVRASSSLMSSERKWSTREFVLGGVARGLGGVLDLLPGGLPAGDRFGRCCRTRPPRPRGRCPIPKHEEEFFMRERVIRYGES